MWVKPITDRTSADILARTAKAFFNIADWSRITGNCVEAQTVIEQLTGVVVALTSLTEPTVTTFPRAEDINALVENIERLRVAAGLPVAVAPVLSHAYTGGAGSPAPDYQAVNQWEAVLDAIYTLLPHAYDYAVSCGVAAAGQPRLWQARFRG